VCPKYRDKPQELVVNIKTTKNIYTNICSEMSAVEFKYKITANNKYLIYVIFYLQLIHYTLFTIHVPSSITVEFLSFIRPQFTTDVQNALHLYQCTQGLVQSLTVTPF
jgi:hypothetical protein